MKNDAFCSLSYRAEIIAQGGAAVALAPAPAFRLTKAQRGRVGAYYLQHRPNFDAVQQACVNDPVFAGRLPPHRNTILRCFQKLESGELGSAPAGRQSKSARSKENVALLYGLVVENDSQSVRTLQARLFNEFGVSMSLRSIWKALHDDLELYAFKYCRSHDLRLGDLDERLTYALEVRSLLSRSPIFFESAVQDDARRLLDVNGTIALTFLLADPCKVREMQGSFYIVHRYVHPYVHRTVIHRTYVYRTYPHSFTVHTSTVHTHIHRTHIHRIHLYRTCSHTYTLHTHTMHTHACVGVYHIRTNKPTHIPTYTCTVRALWQINCRICIRNRRKGCVL